VEEDRAMRTLRVFAFFAAMLVSTGPGISAAAPPPDEAPLIQAKGRALANQYIVVLKPGQDAHGVAAQTHIGTRFVYHKALNGFSATLNAGQLSALRHHGATQYIEQDTAIHLDVTEPMDVNGDPWGLDRIDQRALPLSGSYAFAGNGAGVTAYIIDTGIETSHPEFSGRASVAFDALGGDGQDCNGHGTHVAGIVGGASVGVAKFVTLDAVRVLDCSGSGSASSVIAGIDWVAANSAHPAVANMSLGGGYSRALNSAATTLVNSGVFVGVAAGNSSTDACLTSPASAGGVFATAASDRSDNHATFSNFGPCVQAYAPGVAIKSAWLNGGWNTLSGTSMAAPHVTGVGALYKGDYGDTSAATIASFIQNAATTNVVAGNPLGTPNLLLFKADL
jgi:subtilisin family serine protease